MPPEPASTWWWVAKRANFQFWVKYPFNAKYSAVSCCDKVVCCVFQASRSSPRWTSSSTASGPSRRPPWWRTRSTNCLEPNLGGGPKNLFCWQQRSSHGCHRVSPVHVLTPTFRGDFALYSLTNSSESRNPVNSIWVKERTQNLTSFWPITIQKHIGQLKGSLICTNIFC